MSKATPSSSTCDKPPDAMAEQAPDQAFPRGMVNQASQATTGAN
jgi:hypothetical protein